MKQRFRVMATSLAAMLFLTQAVMPTTVSANTQEMVSASQLLAQLTEEERAIFYDLADELEIEDLDAFFTKVQSRSYSPDDYIDLDGDGDLTGDDVTFLGNFLLGKVDYAYDYNDMDATNDHVIDYADKVAYMECYAYHILLHYPFTPGTHGSARSIDPNFEYRWYVKYDYQTHQQSSPYLLHNSTLQTSINTTTISSQLSDSDEYEEELSEIRDNPSPRSLDASPDTKIVRIGAIENNSFVHQSSGTIVGKHSIATAAHCLYNVNSIEHFNQGRAARAITYTSNGNGGYTETLHALSIKYAIVPYDFITASEENRHLYDYGLLVVEDNLSSYGKASLGVMLNGIATSNSVPGSGLPINLIGFVNASVSAPRIVHGNLYNYSNRKMTIDSLECGPASGSEFIYEHDDYVTDVGIYTSKAVLGPDGPYREIGMIITRPLLEFYLNQNFN